MIVRPAPQPSPSPFPGLAHATLACSSQGLKNLSVWRQRLDLGAATPPHRHDCEEVVLCSAGQRQLELAGELHDFGADSVLVIPRNAWHQIFSVGDTPLEIVGIFAATPVEAYFPDETRIPLPWES